MNKEEMELFVSILTDEQKAELLNKISAMKNGKKAEPKKEDKPKKTDEEKEKTAIASLKGFAKDYNSGVDVESVKSSKLILARLSNTDKYERKHIGLAVRTWVEGYEELKADMQGLGMTAFTYKKWGKEKKDNLFLVTYSMMFSEDNKEKLRTLVEKYGGILKPTTPKAETKVEEVEEVEKVVEEVEDNTTDELEEEDVVEQVEEVVKPKAKKATTKEPTPSLKTANNIAKFAKNIFAKANE